MVSNPLNRYHYIEVRHINNANIALTLLDNIKFTLQFPHENNIKGKKNNLAEKLFKRTVFVFLKIVKLLIRIEKKSSFINKY